MMINNWSLIESVLFIRKKNDIWNMIRKCSYIIKFRFSVGCN